MDDYGIAASALAGLSVYEMAARGSGRTRRMISALVEGANVWCTKSEFHVLVDDIKRRRPDLKDFKVRWMEPSRFLETDFFSPAFFSEQFVLGVYRMAIDHMAARFKAEGLDALDRRDRPDPPPVMRHAVWHEDLPSWL